MSSVSKFLLAFKLGYDLIPSRDEREYTQAKTRYTNAMADYYSGKGSGGAGGMTPAQAATASRGERNLALSREKFEWAKTHPHAAAATQADRDLAGVGLGSSADPATANTEDFDPDNYDLDPVTRIDPADEVEEEVPMQRKGGPVVRRYANGGGVVDDPAQEQAVPLTPGAIPMAPGTGQLAPPPTAALPVGPTAGAGAMPAGPPPAGGASEAAPDGPGFSYQAAVDAAHVGLDAIEEDDDAPAPKTKAIEAPAEKPAKAEAIPMAAGATEAAGPKDIKTPEGAMTVEEMLAMNPIADPKGASGERPRMSESDLTLARLAHAYEGSLKQAKPKLARDIAKSMMKTYEWMSNGYKNLANAKAAQGDVDGAIGAFVRAYNYIPDGKDLKLQKLKSGRYAYQYTDKITGEIIRKGMASPDEILGIATKGFANRWADLVRMARDPDKVADPDVAEAVAGAPAGATEGGSDPAAGGVAGSQPSAIPQGVTLEEAKAVAAKREAPAKEARTEKRALDKEDRTAKRTDARDEKKATARKAEVDQKRVDEMQSRGEWTKEKPATFVTRAEFDLLPPGAYVQRVDKDGNPIGESGLKKRKPQPATAQ